MKRANTIIVAAVVLVGLALAPLRTIEADETASSSAEEATELTEDAEIFDADNVIVGHESSWFLFGGATVGRSFHSAGSGNVTGAQLSMFRLKHGRWVGAYTDVQYDFQADAFTASIGPEMGYKFVGFDAGIGAHFGDGGPTFGPQGRLLLTAGIITLYGRFAHWPELEEQVVQAGLKIKLPLIAPWGFAQY